MVKNAVQMAIGGVIVAVAFYSNSKVTAQNFQNETLQKIKPYLLPIIFIVAGLGLSFMKNGIVKAISTWLGASGVALLINFLIAKATTK